MENTNPSRYLPHGHYHRRLPFVTPEERTQIQARQLEELSSSSSEGDCPSPCAILAPEAPGDNSAIGTTGEFSKRGILAGGATTL